MASPQFVITTAGLAAASVATPSGPYVNIVEFRVGSGYNYNPVAADTGLHGTTLYAAPPRNYQIITGDTIDIVCEMPANVGPFNFGEIGLYLPGGVLFALASWPTPQQKFALATDNLPHVFRFNCLIKLAQGQAVFIVNTTNQNDLLEVPNTSYISAPDQMATQPNAVIVHETVTYSGHFMLIKQTSNRWTPLKFASIITSTSLDSTGNTTTTIGCGAVFSQLDGTTPRRYAIQTLSGEFRLIESITAGVATLSYGLSAPLNYVVDTIEVYEADATRINAVVSNADYNELKDLINPIWAGPSGSTPSTAKGYGQPAISSPIGTTPNFGEWTSLSSAIKKSAQLLNLPTGTDMTGFSSTWSSGSFTKRLRQLSSLNDLAVRVSQYGARVPYSTLNVFNSVSRTLNNYWSQIHHDIDINFSTTAQAQTFFNSGGYLGFALRCTAKNYTQSIQRALYSQLGTIRFTGFQSDSIGALKLVYIDGDGVNTDFGNCGFYGLSGSRRRVFAHRVPLGTDTSKQPDSESIMLEMYATGLSATHIKLEIWITDSSGTPYYDFPLSDPAYGSYGMLSLLAGTSITSQVVYGMAPTSILNNPAMATPSIATSPSSQW